MAAPARSLAQVRFGVFEISVSTGELHKNGMKVRLQDQAFRVLLALLECPGQLVTREELQKKLWSSSTFVEFDDGLNHAIRNVREALGDVADNPRFIETNGRAVVVTLNPSTVILVDMQGHQSVYYQQTESPWLASAVPSPDGRHVAVEHKSTERSIWMLENF